MRAAWIAVAVLGLMAARALWWRRTARRRRLPRPVWMGWLLDNPHTNALAGSATLHDRAEAGPGMRVLDAGCGTGRVTIPAAERVGPGGEVVALDVQEGMLERVRHRASDLGLENVRTVLGAVESRVVEEGTFDRAILATVLGEIPDREGGMGALYAALKPEGILSVTEIFPDPHYQRLRTVRRLAEETGLEWDRTHGTHLAFTMNFRKPAA